MEKEENDKKVTVGDIIRYIELSKHKKNRGLSKIEEIEFEDLRIKAEAYEIFQIE